MDLVCTAHTVTNFAALLFVCVFSGFSISPHSNWVLEVGREYEVSVQIYDRDNRKVYMTDVRSLCLVYL